MNLVRQLLKHATLSASPAFGRFAEQLGMPLKQPVFIVGSGRCGTSLLVKVLNSHRNLIGFPGEANDLWHPTLYPFSNTASYTLPIEADPERFTNASLADWPDRHERKIRQAMAGFHLLAGRYKTFFAKSAMISFMIPKILTIFPAARFIHIYRYGPSVIDSYVKKNFGSQARGTDSYTKEEYYRICARYWNQCLLQIEETQRALSLSERGAFLEFSYENLCDDPRDTLNDVAEFMEVSANDYRYDLTKIESANYKVVQSRFDYQSYAEEIRPAMQLKGYWSVDTLDQRTSPHHPTAPH